MLLRKPGIKPGLSVFGSNKRLAGPVEFRPGLDSLGLDVSRRKSGSFSFSLLTKGPPDKVLVRRLLASRWVGVSRRVPGGSDSATAPRFNGLTGERGDRVDRVDGLSVGLPWRSLPWSGLRWRSLMSSISFLVSVLGPGADEGRGEKGDVTSSPTFGRVESLSLDDG